MVANHRLVKNFLDLGVHIGTDLSHGYNRQYNEYIIGILPYKEKSIHVYINKKYVSDSGRGRIRKIPIIDLYKSLFFLKRAVSFVRGLSMNMGKLLLYHPTLYEDLNFLLVFARIVNKYNHAFLHMPWQYGTLTNYYFSFYTMIKELHDYDSLKRRKKITFTGLFLRLLVYSYLNVPRYKTVQEHIQSSLKFWRAVVFLRYFRVFYAIPDVLITLNPTGAVGAIEEGGKLGIPVVATVDTNGSFSPISYPLLSNDDSYTIAIYYFILFMNVYEFGRVERYRTSNSIPYEKKNIKKKRSRPVRQSYIPSVKKIKGNKHRMTKLRGPSRLYANKRQLFAIGKIKKKRLLFPATDKRKKKKRSLSVTVMLNKKNRPLTAKSVVDVRNPRLSAKDRVNEYKIKSTSANKIKKKSKVRPSDGSKKYIHINIISARN